MRVLQMSAHNFCNLEFVEITAPKYMIKVEGPNESGKTSTINSFFWALCGAKETPAEPIREGAEEARVKVWLGDEEVELIVTKRQTKTRTELEVTDAQGHVIKRPQEVLDGLVSKISFDPTVFIRERADKRKDLLLDVCGVRSEVAALSVQRTGIYDQRTQIGRDESSLKAQVEATPFDIRSIQGDAVAAADALEASLKDTVAENEKRGRVVSDSQLVLARMESDGRALEQSAERHSIDINEYEQEIKRLEKELADYRNSLELAKQMYSDTKAAIKAQADKVEAKKTEIAALPQPDPEALQTALELIKNARKKADTWSTYCRVKVEHAQKKGEYDRLTSKLAEIDDKKRQIIRDAVQNIGMGYEIELDEDDTLRINGRSFDSHSTAGQLKISAALAMATNPKLRVLRITHGSEVDESGMKMLYELAEKNNFDIWIERVASSKSGAGIFIHEGRVVE